MSFAGGWMSGCWVLRWSEVADFMPLELPLGSIGNVTGFEVSRPF
jgi:hypothetical protein